MVDNTPYVHSQPTQTETQTSTTPTPSPTQSQPTSTTPQLLENIKQSWITKVLVGVLIAVLGIFMAYVYDPDILKEKSFRLLLVAIGGWVFVDWMRGEIHLLRAKNILVVMAVIFAVITAWSMIFHEDEENKKSQASQRQAPQQWKWSSRSQKTLGPGKHHFVLSPGEQTPWIKVPVGIYDIYLPDGEGDFSVYYSDGTHIRFNDGENKKLPRKQNVKFKITSEGVKKQHFTVTAMSK